MRKKKVGAIAIKSVALMVVLGTKPSSAEGTSWTLRQGWPLVT